MKKKLSIILPCFNEAGNIGKLISKIYSQEELIRFKLEFIVIDDNSLDDTQNVVKKLIRRKLPIKLLIRQKERGLATAILKGLSNAAGDYLIIMDTDFNHRPEDIIRLLEPIRQKQADLVIGSRYIPGGGMHLSEASQLQYWFSKWGNFIVNKLMFNLPVHESLSGFLALRKSVLNKLNLIQIFNGYGEYCIRLIFYCHKQGFKIKEIPIMYGLRQYGVSKSSLKRMIYQYSKTALELKFNL